MSSATLQDIKSIQQKWFVYLCTCNEQYKNEIKKTIPPTKASQRIKYSVINITKEVQDWYTERN